MYCWISVQQHVTDREKCYLWQLNTSVWNQYRVQRHSEHIAAFTICTNVAPVTLYPLTNQLYTGKSIEALSVPADSILLLPWVYFWKVFQPLFPKCVSLSDVVVGLTFFRGNNAAISGEGQTPIKSTRPLEHAYWCLYLYWKHDGLFFSVW